MLKHQWRWGSDGVLGGFNKFEMVKSCLRCRQAKKVVAHFDISPDTFTSCEERAGQVIRVT
jgi:hypothetical protein